MASLTLVSCGGGGKQSAASGAPTSTATGEATTSAPPASAPVKPRGGARISFVGRRSTGQGQKPAALKTAVNIRSGDQLQLIVNSRRAPRGAQLRVTIPAAAGRVLRPRAELIAGGDVISRSVATLTVQQGQATLGDIRFFFPGFKSIEADRSGPSYVLRAPAFRDPSKSIVLYLAAQHA